MNTILNATEFGIKRANQLANPKNALRIEQDKGTTYQKTYTKTVSSDKKLVSVVVDGETFTFTDTILVQNVKGVEAAIAALLVDKEIGVFVRAQYKSGDLTIKYISSARRLGTITLETAGAMSSSETSTVQTHCRVAFTLIDDEELEYNGTPLTLANSPYMISGDDAQDEVTRATLDSDFKSVMTGASATYEAVSVRIVNDEFAITYRCKLEDADKLTVAGRAMRVKRVWETFDNVTDGFYNFE